MIVRTLSDLDPIAPGIGVHHLVHPQMLGVRARQRRPFRAPLVMDQLTCTRFFFSSRSTRLANTDQRV